MAAGAFLVRAERGRLAEAFPLLADLQPLAWTDGGLLVAPGGAADPRWALARLAACPLPVEPHPVRGPWPEPPARWVAGIYRRSPDHAPAPDGVPEIIQVSGEGFGPFDHATTVMCLAALPSLVAGPALDVGCGSGLLGLWWARAGKGPVLAVDPDPAAVRQARASARRSGLDALVEGRVGRVERLAASDIAGRVILANVPVAVHRALTGHLASPPPALVASGLRPGQVRPLLTELRRLGLRRCAAARRGRWECHVLRASPP